MKTKIILTLGIFVTLMSCKKEETISPTNPNNPANVTDPTYSAGLTQFFESNKKMAETFSISATNNATVQLSSGTFIEFSGGFIDANGNSVNGSVDVEIIEINKVSDMILSRKPTNSENGPLSSAGEFSIIASQNGENVYSATNDGVSITTPTEVFIDNMQFWTASDADENFNWRLSDSTEVEPIDSIWTDPNDSNSFDSTFFVNNYYNVITSLNENYNWVNLDYILYNDECGSTVLNVSLHEEYTNYNTSVFVIFDNFNAVIEMYHYNNNTFSLGNYFDLSACEDIQIVAISEIDEQFFLGHTSLNTSGDTDVNLNMTAQTDEEIAAFLSEL